ncbi:Zinc finger CCCH-type antiviral protein 1 ADP-ribosyltransferase diphtheria toxin-like 13 [Collichthys lucidus]|uniref:Zinc finger CCCH-type antiviral protein 1 ADP-ribosyltransferase diphtheria toxin-like 13 n=1 Tax=Collichthys lucidus TaxID=240159 RepID=A0A4U5VQW5_COLLU|nr:Zinc finger CCCH-type antiviral protein 1 ADP-ribosyltransferase diphtheria toxin-like 13 [Collichthys lucidus]
MSGYSREVLLATSVLCGAGGAVQARELHRKLLQHCDVTKEEFDFIMQRCPRFLLVPDPAGGGGVRLEDCTVIARTSLRLCGRYGREKGAGAGREECTGAGDCQDLHLCKFFIYGNCRFGKGRCVCYNKGSGPHGGLHLPGELYQGAPVVSHFIQGDCMFGLKCKRRMPLTSEAAADECRRVHFHLPYKWEVCDGSTWTDLPHMEDIERDFCDPSKTQSMPPLHGFLSNKAASLHPDDSGLWYYKGDQGNWVEYGQPQRITSVTSRMLEEAFLSDRMAEVKVVKGQRTYVVSFNDMYQRNPKHNTKRRVRRRPRFVSVAEVLVQILVQISVLVSSFTVK